MLITHILTQKLPLLCLGGASSSSSTSFSAAVWSLVGPGASASLLLSLVIALDALTHEDASKYVSFFWDFFYFFYFYLLKVLAFSFFPNLGFQNIIAWISILLVVSFKWVFLIFGFWSFSASVWLISCVDLQIFVFCLMLITNSFEQLWFLQISQSYCLHSLETFFLSFCWHFSNRICAFSFCSACVHIPYVLNHISSIAVQAFLLSFNCKAFQSPLCLFIFKVSILFSQSCGLHWSSTYIIFLQSSGEDCAYLCCVTPQSYSKFKTLIVD